MCFRKFSVATLPQFCILNCQMETGECWVQSFLNKFFYLENLPMFHLNDKSMEYLIVRDKKMAESRENYIFTSMGTIQLPFKLFHKY